MNRSELIEKLALKFAVHVLLSDTLFDGFLIAYSKSGYVSVARYLGVVAYAGRFSELVEAAHQAERLPALFTACYVTGRITDFVEAAGQVELLPAIVDAAVVAGRVHVLENLVA